MTLKNALAMRALRLTGDLYTEFESGHAIYIFRWDLAPVFKIAMIDMTIQGDTPEEVGRYEEWIENEGFEDHRLSTGHHAAENDWLLVETVRKGNDQNYTMVQRLVTWAGLLDRYNQNPQHHSWPLIPHPEELEVFFRAQ